MINLGSENRLLILADDLTGAMDTGSYPATYGTNTSVVLFTGLKSIEQTTSKVISINTNTRKLSNNEASSTYFDIGRSICGSNISIFKKIDGGFRGNVFHEIEGLMRGSNFSICVLVAAIPDFNTYTLNGYQYISGKLLTDSIYTKDPAHPPISAFIPDLLGSSQEFPVISIGINEVRDHIFDSVKSAIINGSKIIVLDALTNSDCIHIVSSLTKILGKILWAGTLGLMKALSSHLFGDPIKSLYAERSIRCACFTASTYSVTKNQILFSENNGLTVIQLEISSSEKGDLDRCIAMAVEKCLEANKVGDFILVPSVSRDIKTTNLKEFILSAVARSAKVICSSINFDRLVVIGGDTASAILNISNTRSATITGKPEDGIAEGVLLNGEFSNIEFASKGGSVGSINAIQKMCCKKL